MLSSGHGMWAPKVSGRNPTRPSPEVDAHRLDRHQHFMRLQPGRGSGRINRLRGQAGQRAARHGPDLKQLSGGGHRAAAWTDGRGAERL